MLVVNVFRGEEDIGGAGGSRAVIVEVTPSKGTHAIITAFFLPLSTVVAALVADPSAIGLEPF